MDKLGICIDWIFRIIQIITFVFLIIQSVNRTGYSNNVKIKKLSPEQDGLCYGFRYVKSFQFKGRGDKFIIYPDGVDIKKITFYSLDYDIKTNKLFPCETLDTVMDIVNGTAVVMETMLSEGIPTLKVDWETSDGKLGEHIFYYNGFNGYQDVSYYKYRLTARKKLLSLIGIK